MTVINPNSISGITSITLPSGGDNVLTIHTNDGVERFRIDSSGNIKVGSAATISPDGDVFFTGVTTATTFTGAHSGSGANLTSLPAAQLTGSLPAISGANLTGIAATDNVRTGILDVAGIATFRNDVNIGAAVTISESGIDAVGLGITCANINGGQIGGRRRISINGDMIIAQRATSASVSDGSNEGYSTVDRWYVLHSSSAGGVATWSQDTDVPTDYSWGRFSHSLKADVTTADTSIASNHAITLQYKIEAQDIRNSGWDYTNSSSTLSVSFWAKSVKAGTYCVSLHTHDGTVADIVKEYTLVANTWKHVELEFPGNSGLTINDDNNSGLTVLWALVVGSNRQLDAGTTWTTRSGEGKYGSSNQVNFYDSTDNNFFLTGVQIEVGKATTFEHRSHGEELALCQRYYYMHADGSDTGQYEPVGTGCWYSGSEFYTAIQHPTTMRAAPSLDQTSGTNYYYQNNAGAGGGFSDFTSMWKVSNKMSYLQKTGSSGTQGAASMIYVSSTSAKLGFSAEL